MTQVSLEEAQRRLPELIDQLVPGEEVQITRGEATVARLVAEAPRWREPRRPGLAKGRLIIIEEDDIHLDNFKKHMF